MIRPLFAAALAVLAATLPARAEVEIQTVTTPGGITAWLVEEHSIPIVALELLFRGGSTLDHPDKRGATYLMTQLLEEGAGDLDAREFAKARDGLASSISFDINDDAVSVSAYFLTENRDETLALLRDALTAPRFDEDAIERVRAQVLSSLQSDLKDPESLASQTFDQLIYDDHPYAHPIDGTIASVTALTRDDLLSAHKTALTREGVYVSAVGDISADELSALLDTLLMGLTEALPPLPDQAEINLPGGT